MLKWIGGGAALVVALVAAWNLYSTGEEPGGSVAGAESASAPSTEPGPNIEDSPDAEGSEPEPLPSRAETTEHVRAANAVGEAQSPRPAESPVTDDEALTELHARLRAADALPAERQFLLNDSLKVEEAMEMVGSGEFEHVLDELAREAYGDFDAQDLSDVYRDYVASILAERGDFALERLVCGMRICMGRAVALESGANWLPLNLSWRDGPPMYAAADGTFTRPDGTTVYQFLFTTDPESRDFVIPTP